MTRDEILALKPGRELDALVAKHVMGHDWSRRTVLFLCHLVRRTPRNRVLGEMKEGESDE